ncbi:MAG TPA: hypothetical protein VK735_39825 [Pseudonocardia sp.]|uniref:hypothetical protein n=1 Tax=Pseudonocardia sp. TaxID=60912 RepID=UPI002BDA2177|nr:hypothetical protein [Pseudonocardia sp.]HTF53633.1 hypothetical protein [Pseudonocardia sp.]
MTDHAEEGFAEPTDGTRENLVAYVAQFPCPRCSSLTLTIQWRLEAVPLGQFSLSGNTMKVSAYEWPYIICTTCGIECRGEMSKESTVIIEVEE